MAGDRKDSESADGFGQKWIHNQKTEHGRRMGAHTGAAGGPVEVAENTKVTYRPYL